MAANRNIRPFIISLGALTSSSSSEGEEDDGTVQAGPGPSQPLFGYSQSAPTSRPRRQLLMKTPSSVPEVGLGADATTEKIPTHGRSMTFNVKLDSDSTVAYLIGVMDPALVRQIERVLKEKKILQKEGKVIVASPGLDCLNGPRFTFLSEAGVEVTLVIDKIRVTNVGKPSVLKPLNEDRSSGDGEVLQGIQQIKPAGRVSPKRTAGVVSRGYRTLHGDQVKEVSCEKHRPYSGEENTSPVARPNIPRPRRVLFPKLKQRSSDRADSNSDDE